MLLEAEVSQVVFIFFFFLWVLRNIKEHQKAMIARGQSSCPAQELEEQSASFLNLNVTCPALRLEVFHSALFENMDPSIKALYSLESSRFILLKGFHGFPNS